MCFGSTKNLLKLLVVVTVLCGCAVSAGVTDTEKNEKKQKILRYIALGDSIPNGYSVSEEEAVKGYPEILAKDMEEANFTVHLSEYTVNGITVSGLYERYLSDADVQKDLKKADLITVTVGANDLLKKFRGLYGDIFGEDPKRLEEALKLLDRWEADDFKKDWKLMMESIKQNTKKDCQIIVTTLYNPLGEEDSQELLISSVEKLLSRMNEVIVSCSETYGYQTADLSEIGTGQYLQSDGLHPNGQGQKLIAEKIEECRR